MAPCEVCRKHQSLDGLPGGVIFENDLIFIAHFPWKEDVASHYGHIILELKRHLTSPREMSAAEASAVGIWHQRLSQFLENRLGAEHTYLFRIGDVTSHLHFHAVPRFKNTPREIWGIYLYQNPQGRKASRLDIEEISNQARQEFLQYS